jgi:(-)-germacrene D synthase
MLIFIIEYLIDSIIILINLQFYKLAQSYLVETKWCNEGFIPTYNEYKANGLISSTIPLSIISFNGLGEFSNKELLDWIFSDPKIINAVSAIGRLADDVSSHKVQCYFFVILNSLCLF